MLSSLLPANRVAAIATFLTGLAASIGSIENTLPGKWQNAALGIAGLATSAASGLHFMTGSQKYDQLTVGNVELAGPDQEPPDADLDIDDTYAPERAGAPDEAKP
jgi:hypothetical protein